MAETVAFGDLPLEVSGRLETPRTASPLAGIVVLHEIWGLTDSIVELVDHLGSAGYTAAAPDLYHRTGLTSGELRTIAQARRAHDTLTAEGLTQDVEGALAWCRSNGSPRVAVIGFSMGGTLALWAASALDVNGAVTFYGGGLTSSRWSGLPSGLDAARALKAPWLGIYGGGDRSTPGPALDRLRQALPEDVPSDVVVYPKAPHGFALGSGSRRYSAALAREAFETVDNFIHHHLGPSGPG